VAEFVLQQFSGIDIVVDVLGRSRAPGGGFTEIPLMALAAIDVEDMAGDE
jgi:hypothetical protein